MKEKKDIKQRGKFKTLSALLLKFFTRWEKKAAGQKQGHKEHCQQDREGKSKDQENRQRYIKNHSSLEIPDVSEEPRTSFIGL